MNDFATLLSYDGKVWQQEMSDLVKCKYFNKAKNCRTFIINNKRGALESMLYFHVKCMQFVLLFIIITSIREH